MRRRDALTLGFFGLLASACTVLVGNQLGKYSDFKVSDAVHPGSQQTDPCALTGPDAGNACSECIAEKCAADYSYACQPDGSTKSWFSTMQKCAEDPVEGYRDGRYAYNACSSYNRPDAEQIGAEDEAAHERAALICVRDKCYKSSPTPPCYQCSVGIKKPGSGSGVAVLQDSDCGRCIADNCGAVLVRCCDQVPEALKACAYPQDPTNKGTCVALLGADAGKDPADGGNVETKCQYDLAMACYGGCIGVCKLGH